MIKLVTMYNQDDSALGRGTYLPSQLRTGVTQGQASEHLMKSYFSYPFIKPSFFYPALSKMTSNRWKNEFYYKT